MVKDQHHIFAYALEAATTGRIDQVILQDQNKRAEMLVTLDWAMSNLAYQAQVIALLRERLSH